MVLTIIAYDFFLQGVDVFYSDAPLPGVRGKRRADELPSGERPSKRTASGTTCAGTPGRVVGGPKGFGKLSTQDDPGRAESSLGVKGAGAQADPEPTPAAAEEQADAYGDAAPGTQAAADGVKAGVPPPSRVQPGSTLIDTALGARAGAEGVKAGDVSTQSGGEDDRGLREQAPGTQPSGGDGAAECATGSSRPGGDAGARTNAGGRLSSSLRRSLPCAFSPLGAEGGPGRRAGKEATGDNEEEVEDIPHRQRALPWTNYISPLQASRFQVGQQEREALKKVFDDAADKADAEAMNEAGIILMQKNAGLPKRRRPVAKTSAAKLTAKLEEALKESNDLRTQLAGNFCLSFALIGFVLALWIDFSFPAVAQATIESDAAEKEQLAKDLKDKTTAFDNFAS
uniref:Uncharacterized protein n=1 Tax=Oryza glumipatula TaxID=40148 RepID=A0A0D9Z9I3_9ORYZ